MKKLFSLLSFVAICGFVNAQTISVADVEVLQGTETGTFTISGDVGDAVYTGFEFDIAFPKDKGFTAINKASASDSWENGAIMFGDLTDGGCTFSGLTTGEGKVPSGEIGTVTFKMASTIALGEYEVTIKNFVFMDGTNSVPANDVTFKVIVTDRVTLDEDATVAPAAATGVNVKVKRTINANEWGTICLPFAMTAAQVKAAFGDDVKLGDFDDYDTEDEGSDVIGITLNFSAATAIEANHPYILKTSSAITSFEVDGVDIDPEDEPCVEYDNGLTGKKRVVYGTFYGTYVAETEIPATALFLSGNKFYYSKGATKSKAFRGYFDLVDVLSGYDISSVRFGMTFGDATGIQNVSVQNEGEAIYNLNGLRVKTPAKGLYIKNGKKVIIK